MSKLSLGPVGIALNVSADDTYLKDAAELEELGYSTLWLPGGQIDTLDRIAAIAGATTSVPVGSAIIPVDVYGPAEVSRSTLACRPARRGASWPAWAARSGPARWGR